MNDDFSDLPSMTGSLGKTQDNKATSDNSTEGSNTVDNDAVKSAVNDVEKPKPVDSALENQRNLKRAALYEILAKLLPVEGRDYLVNLRFKEGTADPVINMRGLTEIGKTWVDYLYKNLPRKTTNE